jgi:deoxyadenosine/deoxycytidine kinase
MSLQIPYKYVCIEGNIGTGKTTLCHMLAHEFNCRLILEEFRDNPFLPYFYADPERYAFTVELFFMTERHKQIQKDLLHQDLFYDFAVSDYCFWKTLIFARNNLTDQEYKLFQRLFSILNNSFPNPDLLVYLHRSPGRLLDQIKKRDRSYEKKIDKAYLQSIQDSYFEFFRSQVNYPILILDVEEIDYLSNQDHYQEIKKLITRKYLPGIHRVSLRF